MFRSRIRVEPIPPTMEAEMADVISKMERLQAPPEVRPYAPPQHADRVSATSQVMCDAIEKVFVDTAAGLDASVEELAAKLHNIDAGVHAFKEAMRGAADELKRRVEEVMFRFEDIASKLQQSPFNGELPKFLEPTEQAQD